MKTTRNQRFYWTEPFSFTQTRARSVAGTNKLKVVAILAAMLAVPLVMVNLPRNSSDLALVVLLSVTPALLIAYPGMWLFSRIPNSVLVVADRIIVGREVIQFTKVQSAIVGTTRMGGAEHRIFAFRTTDGHEYLYGLGHKINAEQLAAFLQQAGVHEPPA